MHESGDSIKQSYPLSLVVGIAVLRARGIDAQPPPYDDHTHARTHAQQQY